MGGPYTPSTRSLQQCCSHKWKIHGVFGFGLHATSMEWFGHFGLEPNVTLVVVDTAACLPLGF